jgi:hypothetical protein
LPTICGPVCLQAAPANQTASQSVQHSAIISAHPRSSFTLTAAVSCVPEITDTEEATGSNPVSPTTYKRPRADEIFPPQATRPPSSTGGSPPSRHTTPGPLPWLPNIPTRLQNHPVWGTYLAKRSQLVADFADHVREQAGQADTVPVWASVESNPSPALRGDLAVWRAANGIDPLDSRPTGGHRFETVAGLWKQQLDADVARASEPPPNSNVGQRHAARKALRHGYDEIQRLDQRPRPSGPPAPGR